MSSGEDRDQRINSSKHLEEQDSRLVRILRGFVVGLTPNQVIGGLFLVGVVGATLLYGSVITDPSQTPEQAQSSFFRELAAAILVAGASATIIQVFLTRYTNTSKTRMDVFLYEELDKKLEKIEQQRDEQVQQLSASLSNIEAMQKSGIARVYMNRDVAYDDLKKDIESCLADPSTDELLLIGISLNDFTQSNGTMYKTWRLIRRYISGDKKRETPIHIRALIIHPQSNGARLRSEAESRTDDADNSRLYRDVIETGRIMIQLEERSRDNDLVSFEVRMYSLPPILFLCHSRRFSYVQQYYFWKSRSKIPIIRYSDVMEPQGQTGLHREIQDHFNWIWDHASIPARDVLYEAHIGVDDGIHGTKAVNIFNDINKARERIMWLLTSAQEKLYIQGISLKSYFRLGDQGDLFQKIIDLAQSRSIVIKVLILDPDCKQAYQRSYIENILEGKFDSTVTFANYYTEPKYKEYHDTSALKRDTIQTVETIKRTLVPRLDEAELQIRMYDCAPACFMLMADNSVIVEQYHYGKASTEQAVIPDILGKEMPIIEFQKDDFGLPSTRNPYMLLENHFDFVFSNYSKPIPELENHF